jgi:hypothetical protein
MTSTIVQTSVLGVARAATETRAFIFGTPQRETRFFQRRKPMALVGCCQDSRLPTYVDCLYSL